MDRLISEQAEPTDILNEIQKEIKNIVNKPFYYPCDTISVGVVLKIIDKYKAIPSADKWIPVSERLPEETGEYLCWVKREQEEPYIDIEQIDCDGMIKEWNMVKPWEVIAWMPLPSPYKGEQNEADN